MPVFGDVQPFTDSSKWASKHTPPRAGGKPAPSPLRQEAELAMDRLVVGAIFDALGTGKVDCVYDDAAIVRQAMRA